MFLSVGCSHATWACSMGWLLIALAACKQASQGGELLGAGWGPPSTNLGVLLLQVAFGPMLCYFGAARGWLGGW